MINSIHISLICQIWESCWHYYCPQCFQFGANVFLTAGIVIGYLAGGIVIAYLTGRICYGNLASLGFVYFTPPPPVSSHGINPAHFGIRYHSIVCNHGLLIRLRR